MTSHIAPRIYYAFVRPTTTTIFLTCKWCEKNIDFFFWEKNIPYIKYAVHTHKLKASQPAKKKTIQTFLCYIPILNNNQYWIGDCIFFFIFFHLAIWCPALSFTMRRSVCGDDATAKDLVERFIVVWVCVWFTYYCVVYVVRWERCNQIQIVDGI